ncbi:MAG: TonB-dependent siderophore receptor [Halieaceae bacterium]|jgi:catecholate siderophore receptor|nr:TonB-dependent siderophore receptor [Halieaceae bacterium]
MLQHPRRLRPLAAAVAIAVSPAISAQNDTIEEVLVQGRYLSGDALNSVKTPTPVIDVPQSLSILTELQIEEQAFRDFGDVLRYTPGMAISQGEGHRDAIIIRGVQTTADFFIDGIRDDVQYFRPFYNVQQIEVLRGPNALLFGRGGGGGVINRVQKTAQVGENFTSFNGGIDTFSAYTGGVDTNLSLTDDIALRINGYYEGLDNHRDFFDGERYAVNPTLTALLGENTRLTASYEYVNDDRFVDRGVPSQRIEDGPNTPLTGYDDTFFGARDGSDTTLQAHILRARVEHRLSEQISANATVHYADYDKAYRNLYPSDEVIVTDGRFDEVELDGYADATQRENFIVQANLVGEFETGILGHTLMLGAEFGDQQTGNTRDDTVFAANGDDQLVIPFTDPLEVPDFSYSNRVRDRESDVRYTSVYLQDQLDLTESFKVVLGLRYDVFDIDVLDFIEAGDGDALDGNFGRKDTELTPRLGFIYKPAQNVSLYASYSETFLPRSGDQFLTLDLTSQGTRPQYFENREVGVKWDISPRLSLTSAVFDLERESFTSIDPTDQEQVIVIDGSTTRGFEVQLVGNLTDRWSLSTGYSYLDGEVERADGGGFDGNRTRQTPENMFSLWTRYDVTGRLSLAVGGTYQDSFFVLEDNATEVPDYTRLDAAAYYQATDSLRFQLNVENLLDEDYFPDAHSNDNISTGRPLNARLSVVMDF